MGRTGRCRRTDGDEGFTLVETVVAMLVFSVFSVVLAQYLLGTLRLTQNNTQRVVAANLAAEQLELARSLQTLALPDGLSELPDHPVVNGTTYTLTRNVAFVAGPGGGSVCAGGSSSLSYKLVTILVDWSGRPTSIQRVRSDTLKTLGLGAGGADVTRGSAAISVQGSGGAPSAGRLVTLQPGALSGRTGTDGCAVFPNLTAGATYTATVDEYPYVGQQGQQVLSTTVVPVAGRVVRGVLTYEPRGSLAVTLRAPSGLSLPPAVGVTLNSSVLAPSTTRAYADCSSAPSSPQNCVSGTGTRTATALFPATYSAWPGTCSDARPASPLAQTVVAGGTGAVDGALGGLSVSLGATAAARVGSSTLYAYHRAGAGCAAGEVFALAGTGSRRALALPAGTWDLVLVQSGTDAGANGWAQQTVLADQVTSVALP